MGTQDLFFLRRKFLLPLVFLAFFANTSYSVTKTSIVAGGSWSNTATWSPAGVPAAGDVVIIATNVSIVGSTTVLNSITINAGSTLSFSTAGAAGKTLNIVAGGSVVCNGTIDMTGGEGDITIGTGSTFTMGPGSTFIWLPSTNTAAGATIFTNTTESFDPTSTLRIDSWYDTSVPLKQNITGNLGNVTFNTGAGTWDQKGTFSPSVIQGTLTMSGTTQIVLDGGTGMTTSLTLQDVIVNGGTLIVAQGANRNLTLTTGDFTLGAGAILGSIMYQTAGTLSWTVNGNVSINNDFTLIQGPSSGAAQAATSTTNVNGTFTIGGGLFDMHRGLLTGNCTITTTGLMTISGSPGWVRFMDMDAVGNLNVTTGGLTVSGGGSDYLFLVDGTTNTATYTLNGNLDLSGAGTLLYLMGGDNGGFPLATVSDPRGNLNLIVTGTFSQSGGTFRGIQNNATANAGTFTMNLGAINFTGGVFLGHYASNVTNATATVNVTGNASFNFAATTDQVWFVALGILGSTPSTLSLNMTIGGDLTIAGAAASWRSSNGTGAETISIGGNVNISGGINSFNLATASTLTNYHDVTGTVAGNFSVSGGTTHLSAKNGTVTSWIIDGNVSISGGLLGIKGGTGAATFNVLGGYSQSGGTFFLHNASTAVTANVIAVTINSNNDATGDFSHTGGTLNFDDCSTAGAATHTLTIYSPSYTVGGAAGTSITRAGAGTGALFGEIYFARAAGTTYSRSSTSHSIQQVKQIINSGVTVNASGSGNSFQIATNATLNNIAGTATNWALTINGTLNMGSTMITGQGPSLTGHYSGVKLNSGAALITANANGFYNGVNGSATLEPQVFSGNTSYRMDYSLNANSTIEYNGSANQVVTGKYPNVTLASDVQAATAAQYRYGILKINNQGTVGTNYAYPAVSGTGTGNVFVRTTLTLARGELNLAGSGTGQTIVIENGATTAIERDGATTVGYIKSEETNSGNNRAKVQWNINANAGAHIYPFGLYAGAIEYLPVTINNSGNIGEFTVSTRATASNNTTWAAASNNGGVNAVNHMYDPTLAGDGSIPAVIDRWWDFTTSLNLTTPCTTTVASTSVTFTYRGAENSMSAPYNTGEIAAQHWGYMSEISAFGWESPSLPASSTLAVTSGIGSVTIPGLTKFSPYVLSSIAAPLPIELISFEGNCKNSNVDLTWTTASETNNDFFTIEKQTEGSKFKAIGTVKGAGNSQIIKNYSFTDPESSSQENFYRIKQTDVNGRYSYSDVIVVKCESAKPVSLLSCSGTGDLVKLQFNSQLENETEIEVKLIDVLGKEITRKKQILSPGINQLLLNLDTSEGIYFVNIQYDSNIESKRIFLKN